MVDFKIILGAEVVRASNNAHQLVILTNRVVLHHSQTLTSNDIETLIATNNLSIIRSKLTSVASRIKLKTISSEVTCILMFYFVLLMLLDWLFVQVVFC
jgi:hypothetical protein